MKELSRKVIIITIGIIINVVGRLIADTFNWPIWFDMVGTIITSYFVGLWGGVLVGIAQNIILSLCDITAFVYLLTNLIAAFIIHIFVKKGYMNNVLKAVVSSFWLGIICTLVSTPLNLIFYDGYSGNIWGDTLVDMLNWYDVSKPLAALAGEVVVEIVDKQICVLCACLIIYITMHIKKINDRKGKALLLILLSVMLATFGLQPLYVQASSTSQSGDGFVEKIYNNTNGMVSSEANVICETEDGCIWIGSYAGLTKYDGNEFEFIREGGLVNVVGMMTDHEGRLWIGTNDVGIARYENGKYTYFTEEDGLPSNSIRCFAEDKDGNVYVGTSDKICKFRTDDTIEIIEQDITFVKAMVVYNDMLVVMDNNGSIYAINDDKKLTMHSSRKKDYFYYCLEVTSKGLMVGTESGELFVLDISEQGLSIKNQIDISAEEISAIFEDSQKRIWIATEAGLGYIDKNGKYHEMSYAGFDSSIVYFHEDYQGNIWVASYRYGVMKLSESSFVNVFEKAGIERKAVNAITYYHGDYYCGMDDGLLIFDGRNYQNKTNELTEMTKGYRVRSVYTDSKDGLWICTYNGLVHYNSFGKIRCYNMETDAVTSDRFRCITELEDETLAVGTADGINFIKGGKLTGTMTSQDGLANTQILSIVEGHDGMVWAGSDGSGIYIISDGKLVENYTVEQGLSSNVILRIIPYEHGYIVVTSNALCHIDLKGNIRKLTSFPYFNNYDVMIDGEFAYITCSAGMYETKLSELCDDNGKQFRFYGANEGLISGLMANSWNYLSEEGILYLCSNNGVIAFDGDKRNSDIDMKYGIVSVECDGEKIELSGGSHFVVPTNVRNISINASVRNYAFTDVKVRFFVKELDDMPEPSDWNEIEPIRIFKPDLLEYNIYFQILDSSGENVLQEQVYTVSKKIQTWEKPVFKSYLVLVCLEIFLFVIISIVSMIFFVLRKNELEREQFNLAKKVDEQTEELRGQQKTIKELFIQTITALSDAVDAKDRYTSGHSKRVAEYSRMIADRLGKSKEEQEEIYRAGLLHDVGKIRIPVEIINKAGKLTDEEYNVIKLHPVTGYHILRGISGSSLIAIAAKYHHERYDGKGYPNGLAGENIPEIARILGVADSYDAMTSNRSYRKALPQEIVRSEIEKGKGTQFDPRIADVMLELMDEDKKYSMRQQDSFEKRILVVDDEIMNIRIIERIMGDEPMYKIVGAGGGREALTMLEAQAFDLVLLDIEMPEMDGWETLRCIREKYQIPVVFMTGDKTLGTSVDYAAFGYDDYITKPFLPLLIKEIVHNMTEKTSLDNQIQ